MVPDIGQIFFGREPDDLGGEGSGAMAVPGIPKRMA
jgi:hypothetical protein